MIIQEMIDFLQFSFFAGIWLGDFAGYAPVITDRVERDQNNAAFMMGVVSYKFLLVFPTVLLGSMIMLGVGALSLGVSAFAWTANKMAGVIIKMNQKKAGIDMTEDTLSSARENQVGSGSFSPKRASSSTVTGQRSSEESSVTKDSSMTRNSR